MSARARSKGATRRGLLLGALAALVVLLALVVAGGRWTLQQGRDAAFWADAIAAFEAADRAAQPAPGGIVFTGSSSIRLWSTLAADLAPLPVRNRGFGGAHLEHVNHYLDRVVLPYRPRAVVLYAGDNDLAAGSGKTPERVVADFDAFVAGVHAALPDARIYFVAIKPSRLRWEQWPDMKRANDAIATRCSADPRLVFLDVATPMLGADGRPRGELFAFDGLHLSDAGYALWVDVVRPRLLADWEAGVSALPR